jgi:CRP-like cAMP-binding protein
VPAATPEARPQAPADAGLVAAGPPLGYAPKQAVFRQGEPTGWIYQILEGRVQLSVVSAQGKAAVVALLGPGDFLGEGCLAGQAFHLSTATAMVETQVVRFRRAAMVRMLRERSEFSERFMGFLLSRTIEIQADLVDQLFNSSERRLARVLLLLANFGKNGSMETIVPKISQELLAARVGTTRSRINFFMNKFRKLGLIEYNGGLKVHSSLVNVIVHE